ncbi:MAG: DUF6677 family protein [Planctomycetota bacterium]
MSTSNGSNPPQGSASGASSGEGNPAVAALLTWLIPGAGHFYLGKMRTALIAFLCIEGLYVAGVLLSKGMFLQILPPEMRGRFAAALTPEAGNLGALLLHVRQYGFGGPVPQAFPDGLQLGVILTASAGIANLILCSRAHFDARASVGRVNESAAPHPGAAALVGWLLPGAGHVMQGRKVRGAVAFVLVLLLFAVGCYLAGGTNLDRARHFYYWAGQSLLGPVAFLTEIAHGHPVMDERVPYADAGVVLSSVAGMLNVLLLLDVYGYSDAKRFGRPVATDVPSSESENGPFDVSTS